MVRGPRAVARAGPRLPWLSSARVQQQGSNAAKNKQINLKIYLKKKSKQEVLEKQRRIIKIKMNN